MATFDRFIKTFENEAAFAAALQDSSFIRPNISLVGDKGTYNIPENAWGLTIPADGSVNFTLVGNTTACTAYLSKLGRYLLDWSGTAKKLNMYDSTMLADDADTVFGVDEGNVMVRIPRLGYTVVRDSSGRDTIWMSEEPVMKHVFEEQWIGAYLGSADSAGRLRSKKGATVHANKTITQFWNMAQANGSLWGLSSYQQRILMVLVYLMKYHSLNSQDSLGYGMNGNTDNWTAAQGKLTGETSSLGDYCGTVDGGTSVGAAKHISLYGLEDIWGWYWETLQGIFLTGGSVCYVYEGNRLPDSKELAGNPKGNYRKFTRSAEGWIKKLVGGEYFDIMPAEVGGGSSSYWCDNTWTSDTGQLLRWGGHAYFGSPCGVVFSNSNLSWSYSSSSSAARLAYYGKVKRIVY